MFGISFSEIILIGVIAIVIFGPEQLPIIAKKAGQLFAFFRDSRQKFSSQMYEQLGIDEFTQLKNELTQTVNEIRQAVTTTSYHEYSENLSQHYYYEIYHQPELDFDSQPELFDE